MKETLWTIQNEAVFEVFQKTGVLRADPSKLIFDGDFQNAYNWMTAQMRKRIGTPPAGVQYPVWAWYQWEGKRKRMDLRSSGYAKRGTPMVQITFEAEPASFLLSDFDAWHIVLANQYLADNEAEWDKFYENNHKPGQADVEPSWERIFDLWRHTPNWDCEPERKSIQATLWEIHMSQVKKVEHFLAK